MPDEITSTAKAPYLPYVSFRKFIASLKAGAIPSRIDKTLMPGSSGSIQSWTISALKFFDLISDNGTPKDDLGYLVEADEEARKQLWKDLFERGYKPLIDGLDLERATLGQLSERFGKDFGGDTVRKCIAFFVAGADDAGITLANHLKNGARGTSPQRSRRSRANSSTSTEEVREHIEERVMPDTNIATLLLDKDGTRIVRLQAPPTVTDLELTRIQQWLSFQLIVEKAAK